MKLRISSRLASVYSEVNVEDRFGAKLFATTTDPLSSPQATTLLDAAGTEVARYAASRSDMKERRHRVALADGTAFDVTRRFRVASSTSESVITAAGTGWTVLTQRGWSSRFEIRSDDGKTLARARQIQALRGDAYDLEVLDESHLVEMLLLALIARTIIREDSPSPV